MYRTRGGNCTIKSETDHTAYITRLRHAPKMVTLIMRNSSRSVGRLSPRRKLTPGAFGYAIMPYAARTCFTYWSCLSGKRALIPRDGQRYRYFISLIDFILETDDVCVKSKSFFSLLFLVHQLDYVKIWDRYLSIYPISDVSNS